MFRNSFLALALSTLARGAPLLQPRQARADVTVVFARGTSEAVPIGTRVGPPLRTVLQGAIGGRSLNFMGVDYPVTITGFLEGGDPNGARTMANDVNSFASACPGAAVIMSGYSQGAEVTHIAAHQFSSTVQDRVKADVCLR